MAEENFDEGRADLQHYAQGPVFVHVRAFEFTETLDGLVIDNSGEIFEG